MARRSTNPFRPLLLTRLLRNLLLPYAGDQLGRLANTTTIMVIDKVGSRFHGLALPQLLVFLLFLRSLFNGPIVGDWNLLAKGILILNSLGRLRQLLITRLQFSCERPLLTIKILKLLDDTEAFLIWLLFLFHFSFILFGEVTK